VLIPSHLRIITGDARFFQVEFLEKWKNPINLPDLIVTLWRAAALGSRVDLSPLKKQFTRF